MVKIRYYTYLELDFNYNQEQKYLFFFIVEISPISDVDKY